MSFEDTVTFLEDYMTNREQELLKGKRMRWSTSMVKTYDELLESFDRTEENADWETLRKSKSIYDKYIKIRGKIGFMAGTARDIRMQFCCGLPPKRQKTIMDTVRYELIRLRFVALNIMRRLREQLKIVE